jgi:hypothetical protein
MTRSARLVAATLVIAACGDSSSTSAPDDAAARGTLASATTTVLLSGLDSPRGLAFGPEGALYVVEAGNGTINGPCIAVARGQLCYSGTGGVTRYWKGQRERVVSGLPSQYNTTTLDVGGPHDIGFLGRGHAFVTIGLGNDPARRVEFGALGADLGHLIKLEPSGKWRAVADVSAVEAESNPAGGPIDSNPFGLLVEPGSRFVADAGGNSLIEIQADGSMSVVATFAPTSSPATVQHVGGGADGGGTRARRRPLREQAHRRAVRGGERRDHAGGARRGADGVRGRLQDDHRFRVRAGWIDVRHRVRVGAGVLRRPWAAHARRSGRHAHRRERDAGVPDRRHGGPDGAVYVSNKGSVPGAGEVLRIVP